MPTMKTGTRLACPSPSIQNPGTYRDMMLWASCRTLRSNSAYCGGAVEVVVVVVGGGWWVVGGGRWVVGGAWVVVGEWWVWEGER